MEIGQVLNFGGGFGLAAAGIGALLKWGAAALVTLRSPANSRGENGSGQWRGRVEQILETVIKVQDRSVSELAELRRGTDRMATVVESVGQTLGRVATMLDEHDRRTEPAAARVIEMADQVDALYRREFPQ